MVGRDTPAPAASPTIPISSARWPISASRVRIRIALAVYALQAGKIGVQPDRLDAAGALLVDERVGRRSDRSKIMRRSAIRPHRADRTSHDGEGAGNRGAALWIVRLGEIAQPRYPVEVIVGGQK